jgi:hypothetical protein
VTPYEVIILSYYIITPQVHSTVKMNSKQYITPVATFVVLETIGAIRGSEFDYNVCFWASCLHYLHSHGNETFNGFLGKTYTIPYLRSLVDFEDIGIMVDFTSLEHVNKVEDLCTILAIKINIICLASGKQRLVVYPKRGTAIRDEVNIGLYNKHYEFIKAIILPKFGNYDDYIEINSPEPRLTEMYKRDLLEIPVDFTERDINVDEYITKARNAIIQQQREEASLKLIAMLNAVQAEEDTRYRTEENINFRLAQDLQTKFRAEQKAQEESEKLAQFYRAKFMEEQKAYEESEKLAQFYQEKYRTEQKEYEESAKLAQELADQYRIDDEQSQLSYYFAKNMSIEE